MGNASMVLYAWGPHRSTFDTKVALVSLEELSLSFMPDRVRHVGLRQGRMVLAVLLTAEEQVQVEEKHGMTRVGEFLTRPDVGWDTVGMVMTAVLQNQVEHFADDRKRKSR